MLTEPGTGITIRSRPGQRGEAIAQCLAALAIDHDRCAQHGVTLALGDERVPARTQQVTGPELQARPATLEGDSLRRRVDLDLDRRGREDQRRDRGKRQAREYDGNAPRRPAPTITRARYRPRPERDRLDALALVGACSGEARGLRRDRRCGHVAVPAGHDLEHAAPAFDAQFQAACAGVQHVAIAQPGGPRDPGAVVEHARLVARGLHEELSVLQREPRNRPGRTCRNDDVAAGTAYRDGKIAGSERAFAQRFAQDQLDVQICSSQRITSAGGSRPGAIVISRRTSRNPVRVPTTV